MLYFYVGVEIDQEEIVAAAGVKAKIKKEGIAVEEMAAVAAKLTPKFDFWYKRNSTLTELSKIINTFYFPVGVEWQGLFDYEEEEEVNEAEKDTDPGHYSIVTSISTRDNKVLLADPFKYYAGKDRKFTVIEFERRWWDINEIINPRSKKRTQIDDYHIMFLICPSETAFPEKLGMTKNKTS